MTATLNEEHNLAGMKERPEGDALDVPVKGDYAFDNRSYCWTRKQI